MTFCNSAELAELARRRASHINISLSEKILSHVLHLERTEKETIPYFRGDIGYIREIGYGRSDARSILSYTSKAEYFRSLATKLRSSFFPVSRSLSSFVFFFLIVFSKGVRG